MAANPEQPVTSNHAGRIDIHSHMLPDIDDGCQSVEASIESIRMLTAAGYVGTICTPHVWPECYPANTIERIAQWTELLRQALGERGIEYRLWSGAEVRLFPKLIDWMKAHGVPTLADTNRVLIDLWESQKWPRWVNKSIDWLLAEGYQPILAHPERIGIQKGLDEKLTHLVDQGVWLQGNFNSMTGEEGYLADLRIRQYLREDRFTFMAMDMHGPELLPSRLDGMQMVADEFGQALLDEMTITRPRQLILDQT